MSPILVRPVREQLEHDRVIRLLQNKLRRKYEVGINPGAELNAAIGAGPTALYPDVVLLALDRGRRLQGVVEVETAESINHLEALAQWLHFGRLRVPFHLYVPTGTVDSVRRFCRDHQIYVSEIWAYHTVGDQLRFNLVFRNREAPPPPPKAPKPAKPPVKGTAGTAARVKAPARHAAGKKKVAKAVKTKTRKR